MVAQDNSLQSSREIEDKLKELYSDVLNQQGTIEIKYGHFQKALDWYSQSLEMKRSMHVIDDNEVCYLIRNMGNAYMKVRNLTKAYDLFTESLELRQKQLASASNPDDYKYELANNYGSLCVCLYLMKKYDQALETANYSTGLIRQLYKEENIILARWVQMLLQSI